jgi:hypothetical protein
MGGLCAKDKLTSHGLYGVGKLDTFCIGENA